MVTEIGEGQHILAHAITQRLTMTSSGAYETLIEGSSKPVAHIRACARITKMMRYSFTME
jgi:hypothetical protein